MKIPGHNTYPKCFFLINQNRNNRTTWNVDFTEMQKRISKYDTEMT